jgi:uncharacterized membrane protein YadS
MVKWIHSRELREYPFSVVLLIELVAVFSLMAAPQHWLRAIAGMAAGMVVAGLLRLTLSNDQAGLLRVRRRAFDVACYWALGIFAFAFGLILFQR